MSYNEKNGKRRFDLWDINFEMIKQNEAACLS